MSNDLVLVSREKVKELIGAMRSVNRGRQYEVRPPVDDEPCYWQRREWVEWGIKVAEDLDADIQRRNITSSGKGKSPMADAQTEAETMLTEYRHALGDGIGADSERYELVCMHWLIGQKYVGLAYSVELHRAYLLFVDAVRPQPDYVPLWLLDAAKELTLLMRTLVVPDQPSEQIVAWGGIERGPVISYRFKLVDAPTRIEF
ncbi:hypothetical protein ACQCLI_31990 (plasmid) [Pseudomonas nitroreducens]|uniref:hypothetical protein n=1 Tax=Pseudomonas nitroreducens TaxID=46680 RepID=UPI00036C9CE3|nr:hypothetical protein [Pseudomonas nitroreducens]